MTKKVIPIKIETECEDKLTGYNKCCDGTNTHTSIATDYNTPEWSSSVTEDFTEPGTCENPYNKLLHGSDKECMHGKCECHEAIKDECQEDRYASAYPNDIFTEEDDDPPFMFDEKSDTVNGDTEIELDYDDIDYDEDDDNYDEDFNVEEDDIRSFNVGNSNYSQHKIQPWDIWEDYDLNPWEADIVKRVLREKYEPGMSYVDSRIMDFKKIIHVARKCIELLKKEKQNSPNF